MRPLVPLLWFLVTGAVCAGPEAAPPEPTSWAVTWYLDPTSGRDDWDGLSEATPKASLEALLAARPHFPPGTKIALKRGTVTRLTRTLALRGGTAAGWVCWGAWGDPAQPKPVVVGSAALPASAWSDPDARGLRTADWTPYLDITQGRSPDGIEQGPGNLWFFGADTAMAPLTGWGWRKAALGAVHQPGDWFYDAAGRRLMLLAPGPAPAATEAAVNRTALDFRGQRCLIVEDWDLRYFGGYGIRGHEARHLRFRRLDLSFGGGGTKVGRYVRLGNGIETNGNVDDVVVEGCRFHQLYDTAFDPQDVGPAAVVQTRLTFRNNLVSRMGLAGVELWLRTGTPGSRLEDVAVTGNTFVGTGTGWGYAQHDHPGQARVGADIAVLDNTARTARIAVTDNVFHGSRLILMAEFRDSRPLARALLAALELDRNQWSPAGSPAVVLFRGTVGADGIPILGDSPSFAGLADWRGPGNTLVPGKDTASVERPATGLPTEGPVTRFGPFALLP